MQDAARTVSPGRPLRVYIKDPLPSPYPLPGQAPLSAGGSLQGLPLPPTARNPTGSRQDQRRPLEADDASQPAAHLLASSPSQLLDDPLQSASSSPLSSYPTHPPSSAPASHLSQQPRQSPQPVQPFLSMIPALVTNEHKPFNSHPIFAPKNSTSGSRPEAPPHSSTGGQRAQPQNQW